MLTFTGSIDLYKKLINNTEEFNSDLATIIFNEKIRILLSEENWSFLEKDATATTVASQAAYNLPANLKKILNTTIQVGDQKYIPREAPDRDFWDRLTASTTSESNIPQWFVLIGKTVEYWPTPSDTSGTIRHRYSVKQKDLSIVDFSTGTITTATNGSTAIVGTGTSWTDKMAGRWIRITDSNTANTGDGEWYEVESITDATNLVLVSPYNGTDITAGTADYILGQVSLIPETYQLIPVYEMTADYWAKEKDFNMSALFENKANELKEKMTKEFINPSQNLVISEKTEPIINPNLTLTQ